MNSGTRFLLAGVAAFTLAPAGALAQDAKNQGYLLDTRDAIVKAVNAGVCVRTSDWTPARAVAECDPDLVKKPAPPPPAPTPAPPAPPPPAQKKPAPPPQAVPQKISFSADALFDFDKSVLKDQGKTMLDDLAKTLQGAKYEVILAIGHTDRIGSAAYNQKLSERRAKSVKDYLVSKGIEANRIYAEGKGKTQPLTKPGDCRGLSRAKLIACLQPDRRVVVEVTGTK